MTTHTPGPWRVCPVGPDDDYTKSRTVGEDRDDESPHKLRVAEAYAWGCCSERDANARLIAAAPDLLVQLKALATQIEMTTGLSVPPGVLAAIAKATA